MAFVTVDVDIEQILEQISDEELEEEMNSRFNDSCDMEDLKKIYDLIISGKKEEALIDMHNFLRDKLGKTL